MTPVLATSDLALGRNRFVLGLIDAQNRPIAEGRVLVEYFKIDASAGTAQKRDEAEAEFWPIDVHFRGTWVAPATFDEAGAWGAQVTLVRAGGEAVASRLSFNVQPRFSAPGFDQPAPRSDSPTVHDVGGDASRLCSSQPPCDLHDLSIADALAPGAKPLVVLFATPAFCTTATCGPMLNIVRELRAKGYVERANFIHEEIYDYPFAELKRTRTVAEWNLPSEPWVFIVDRSGIVRDRFEGAVPLGKLEASLAAVLG